MFNGYREGPEEVKVDLFRAICVGDCQFSAETLKTEYYIGDPG
jgi:hypothetical protein